VLHAVYRREPVVVSRSGNSNRRLPTAPGRRAATARTGGAGFGETNKTGCTQCLAYFRLQIEATAALHPREGLRSSPISGVVAFPRGCRVLAGLLHLRDAIVFPCTALRGCLQ